MKIGSLCTGYGGLDLAVEEFFNARTIWAADTDKSASIVIEQRFDVPNHGDIKNIDWSSVEPIDIMTAGYPCQPFSHAGERKGLEDERHIWPHIAQAIGYLRPRIVVLENVRGHLSLGLKEVLASLTGLGYDARWSLVRASDVGAPHRRERVFIIAKLANTDSFGFPLGQKSGNEIGNQGQSQSVFGSLVSIDSDSNNEHQSHHGKMQELGRRFTPRCKMHLQAAPSPLDQDGKLNAEFVEYMMGLSGGWVTQLGLSRAQQLKMLGNGVVPQQAYYALQLLTQPVDNSGDTPK